ncbi:hypothetical protein CMI37_22695 [Candidatus Pacearchaeota archaeon]|nr:hypothetical protein [Candidatus Pacearchaeota archaeon]|tara:strand:- start:188 stop:571 length:384 start_codon:yes stop_codon:yes gene_type:complete
MIPKLWRAADLSAFLGVTVGAVYGWTSSMQVPHLKIGRSVRFLPEQVEEIRIWREEERQKQRYSRFGVYFQPYHLSRRRRQSFAALVLDIPPSWVVEKSELLPIEECQDISLNHDGVLPVNTVGHMI